MRYRSCCVLTTWLLRALVAVQGKTVEEYGMLDCKHGRRLDPELNSSVGAWNGNGAKNMDSRGLACKVSVGNTASISNWAGGHL